MHKIKVSNKKKKKKEGTKEKLESTGRQGLKWQ